MADHGRQYRGRDVVHATYAQPRHHQIKEHIHSGADFRHALEAARKMGGRGRAHADHRTRQARFANGLRAAHGGPALLLGHVGDRLDAAASIRLAGVRHDAPQAGAVFVQHPGDRQQVAGVARLHAGAMAVAIDLDQGRDGIAGRLGPCRHRPRRLDAVDHHRQVNAARAQRQHAFQFGGRNAHRVKQVGDARGRELLRFLQGRHRGGTLGRRHEPARHVDGLGGLQVGTQLHPVSGHQRVQAVDIARHARLVQQQAGRFQGVQRGRGGSKGHDGLFDIGGMRKNPAPV
ncbi:hypothetical protein D3C72_1440770 [compost metagenome]